MGNNPRRHTSERSASLGILNLRPLRPCPTARFPGWGSILYLHSIDDWCSSCKLPTPGLSGSGLGRTRRAEVQRKLVVATFPLRHTPSRRLPQLVRCRGLTNWARRIKCSRRRTCSASAGSACSVQSRPAAQSFGHLPPNWLTPEFTFSVRGDLRLSRHPEHSGNRHHLDRAEYPTYAECCTLYVAILSSLCCTF